MFGWPILRVEEEKRRLELLRYLAQAPAYEAGGQVLRLHCRQIGVPSSESQIDAALAWLEEQGLLQLRRIGEDVVARVTRRGREAADGIVTVPGVMRPDP